MWMVEGGREGSSCLGGVVVAEEVVEGMLVRVGRRRE